MNEPSIGTVDVARRVIAEIERVEYRSHDPYDLLGSGLIVRLRQNKNKMLSAITEKEPTRKQRALRTLLSPIYREHFATRRIVAPAAGTAVRGASVA